MERVTRLVSLRNPCGN